MRTPARKAGIFGVLLGLLLAIAPSTSANAAIGSCWDSTIQNVRVHVCHAEQWLGHNDSWDFGNARLTMQADGNLVLRDRRTSQAKWSSNTYGQGSHVMMRMLFTTAGQLRVNANDRLTWSSPSPRCASDRRPVIALQADSNFVIYCHKTGSYQYKWATHTVF